MSRSMNTQTHNPLKNHWIYELQDIGPFDDFLEANQKSYNKPQSSKNKLTFLQIVRCFSLYVLFLDLKGCKNIYIDVYILLLPTLFLMTWYYGLYNINCKIQRLEKKKRSPLLGRSRNDSKMSSSKYFYLIERSS